MKFSAHSLRGWFKDVCERMCDFLCCEDFIHEAQNLLLEGFLMVWNAVFWWVMERERH
ncbi:MAG: hypothetical protein Q4C96_10590 [Planctomycetia bacterium]|nr:hypothetical protein [Planctomycetia bacterium]